MSLADHPKAEAAVDAYSERPGADWFIAAAIVAAHIALILSTGHGDIVAWPERSQRVTAYVASSTVVAIMAGFATFAITQYWSTEGDRAKQIKQAKGQLLQRSWLGILLVPGVVAFANVVMVFLDTQATPGPARFLYEFGMLLAIARFARMVYLFDSILDVARADDHNSRRELKGTHVNLDWLDQRRA